MIMQSFYIEVLKRPHPRFLLNNAKLNSICDPLLIEAYEKALSKTQYASPAQLEAIQRAGLLRLIDSAKKHVTFYKEYFKNLNSVEDFYRLPPISKEEIRRAKDAGLLENKDLRRYKIERYTSGSTGVPLNFYADANMLQKRLARYRRMFDWMGRQAGDLIIRIMGDNDYSGRMRVPGVNDEDVFFQCRGTKDLEQKRHELYKLFKGKKIILYTRPSHLLHLAYLIENDKLEFDFRGFVSVSEDLLPEMRSYIERRLNAPVFNFYSSTEASGIGFECEYHDGFHVLSELMYVEIVDDKGLPLSVGKTGDVVVTVLDNEVMPFIKYRLGDKGYWLKDPCLCGRTLPRIKVTGRNIYSFLLPNNEVGYFSNLIQPIAERKDKVFRFQIIRQSVLNFEIKIIPTKLFSAEDQNIIQDAFRGYLGPRSSISIKIVNTIKAAPSGKEHSFINLSPDYPRINNYE